MSKKDTNLTPEEKALLESSLKHTKRLKQDKLLFKKDIKPKPRSRSQPNPEPEQNWVGSYEIYLQNLAPEDWLGPEDAIHFAKVGVQQRTLAKLKKGQLPIDARLDLHGMTADEANASLEHFFVECRTHQVKVVLIVHGKGQATQQARPILKNLVNRWLRENKNVLAFDTCKPKDGGAGAVYVLLRKSD